MVVRGQRPTFISKKAFREHFVEWRIQQSRSLCVAQVNREHYRVVNPKKSTAYSVFVYEDGFDCECEDYFVCLSLSQTLVNKQLGNLAIEKKSLQELK